MNLSHILTSVKLILRALRLINLQEAKSGTTIVLEKKNDSEFTIASRRSETSSRSRWLRVGH
jgi:hypothetical protein